MSDLITTAQIMNWEPCEDYPEERVRALVGYGLDVRGILGLRIPVEDRMWVALREELLSDRLLRLFACDCAELTLERFRATGYEPNPLSWETVEVARQYAVGEATAEALAAVKAAALQVCHCVAAEAVAWSNTEDAAWFAAEEVDCDWQIVRLLELIEDGGGR